LLPYYVVKRETDILIFFKIFLCSSIVPFGFAVVQIVVPSLSQTQEGFRLYGSFTHPNIFAFYCVLIASLCIFLLVSKNISIDSSFRRSVVFILIFSILCLLLTQTRSAWISLFLVYFVYCLLSSRKQLIYVFLLLAVGLMVPMVHDRVAEIFLSESSSIDDLIYANEKLNSFDWRKVVWFSSLDYIFESPFFGYGLNTFKYYFSDFILFEYEENSFDAHNVYIQMLFDVGFFGLFFYFILLLGVINRINNYRKFDNAGGSVVLGVVIGYVVMGFSDNILFYLAYNWYFWFFVGFFCFCGSFVLKYNDVSGCYG
jgi:O-antigen ligase